jgi:hypothetical protein
MRCLGFALLTTALSFAVAGCGDSGVQEGPIEYKAPNADKLGALKDAMVKNMQTKDFMKKTEPKPADAKAPEKKE